MLPRIQILNALKQTLESQVPEDPANPGTPQWKVRHHRFRETTVEEMPCVAIRYIADDAPGVTRGADDPSQLSLAEEVFELRVDFVVDTMIQAEHDRETAGDATEGDDPTGLEFASEIAEACLAALWTAGEPVNTMGGLIWDARYDGTGDNDDVATPDNVRLAESVTLVYRVRADAPYELLIGE